MCEGAAPLPAGVPSPKFQLYETIVPSGSFEPVELNCTVSGALPDVGVAPAAATGGWFGVPPFASISSVMLCAGAVKLTVEAVKFRSARRLIAFAEVS